MADSRKTESTLSTVGPGTFVCVRTDAEGRDGVRLKRLGICEGRTLTLVTAGDPMILEVVGARIGISRQLAGHVVVEPSDASVDAGAAL